jgi:4-amino-4-deoxy-L-arabinose transferase-like glycosyltransferase
MVIFISILTADIRRWVLHPDDWEAYAFSQVFLQTGRLYYNAPLNDLYNTTAFWQPINYLTTEPYSEFSVGTDRAIGYYILLSLGVPFGFGGVLLIHAIMSIVALLSIGLTSRELFGPWGGTVTLLLMSTNGPFILWSQLLLSNNVALGFFFSGFFLCIKGVNSSNSRYYPIAMILMMASFWMRYDYFWLVGLFFLFVIGER